MIKIDKAPEALTPEAYSTLAVEEQITHSLKALIAQGRLSQTIPPANSVLAAELLTRILRDRGIGTPEQRKQLLAILTDNPELTNSSQLRQRCSGIKNSKGQLSFPGRHFFPNERSGDLAGLAEDV